MQVYNDQIPKQTPHISAWYQSWCSKTRVQHFQFLLVMESWWRKQEHLHLRQTMCTPNEWRQPTLVLLLPPIWKVSKLKAMGSSSSKHKGGSETQCSDEVNPVSYSSLRVWELYVPCLLIYAFTGGPWMSRSRRFLSVRCMCHVFRLLLRPGYSSVGALVLFVAYRLKSGGLCSHTLKIGGL